LEACKLASSKALFFANPPLVHQANIPQARFVDELALEIKKNIQPKQSSHRTGAQIPEVAEKKVNAVVANKKRIRYTHGRG
jgi:hypothetical protein